MSISLLTPTQYERLENLSLLKDMINEQTLIKEIKEWIIVDGSKSVNKITKEHISELQKDCKFEIVFSEFDENCVNIGALRNKTNILSTGKILICMDDDDYYPPTRVEEAYTALASSKKLIAGCPTTYFYDFNLDKEFKMFTEFTHGENHTHNNAMAYKREYIVNHKYDEKVTHAEELSFTNKFTEPLEHLNCEKTVVISSHSSNTYSKKNNIWQYYNQKGSNMTETRCNIIPENYLKKMRNIFIKTTKSKYDIVYLCGPSPQWDPRDESLGGSEQAVKYLSINFTNKGFKVAVYGSVPNMTYNEVDYISWQNFPYHEEFNNVIVWRLLGLSFISFAKLKYKRILFDLHDNMKLINMGTNYPNFVKNNSKFDFIMYKSNYHKSQFELAYNTFDSKFSIIPNGLRVPEIKSIIQNSNIIREDFRFCYCSCYTRGLEFILRWVWPQIIKLQPKAELHIYYGMNLIRDDKYKSMMYELIGSSINVMNHDKQPLEVIIQEKLKSTFHLYPTNTELEIDCISIRESILCGCIPLLADLNVFKEREGVKFSINVELNNKEENIKKYAETMGQIGNFIGKMSKEDIIKLRKTFENTKLSFDWEFVADEWIKHFNI